MNVFWVFIYGYVCLSPSNRTKTLCVDFILVAEIYVYNLFCMKSDYMNFLIYVWNVLNTKNIMSKFYILL